MVSWIDDNMFVGCKEAVDFGMGLFMNQFKCGGNDRIHRKRIDPVTRLWAKIHSTCPSAKSHR